jgi:hypothetical protein
MFLEPCTLFCLSGSIYFSFRFFFPFNLLLFEERQEVGMADNLCLLAALDQLTKGHGSYQNYPIRGYTNAEYCNFLASIVRTWRTHELVKLKLP